MRQINGKLTENNDLGVTETFLMDICQWIKLLIRLYLMQQFILYVIK